VMHNISLLVNGNRRSAEVESRTLLVDLLRGTFGLTGTHVGCDTSQCGACTVHVNSRPTKACTLLAVQADGQSVTTIEGIATSDGVLHPMQAAFRQYHGLQCGFCTPGMVMAALAIVQRYRGRPLDESTIRAELEGNFCRCTGYQGIVEAIAAAANEMAHG